LRVVIRRFGVAGAAAPATLSGVLVAASVAAGSAFLRTVARRFGAAAAAASGADSTTGAAVAALPRATVRRFGAAGSPATSPAPAAVAAVAVVLLAAASAAFRRVVDRRFGTDVSANVSVIVSISPAASAA
jgi:hypothetical protein